jgi:hypothetical protein
MHMERHERGIHALCFDAAEAGVTKVRFWILLPGVQISGWHQVRLPSSLALIGKAFGQMQLAAAELDPSLAVRSDAKTGRGHDR